MNQNNEVEKWLKELDDQGKSQHTQQAYRRALAHFIAWHKKANDMEFEPDKIIPRDIDEWKSEQQTSGKAAPATINQRLVALSSFFDWAQKQGLVRQNPTNGIRSVRLGKREPKALKEQDLRRLMRAVFAGNNLRDIAMIELLVGTGLRVGEMLDLKIGDLEIAPRSGQVTVRKGKHGSYREIPLTVEVRKALYAYLEKHPQKKIADAPLWYGQRGTVQTRSAVIRILEKYAIAARIEPIGPHALRHTFASRYLNANPDDLRGLAALLGHASLNTVMIYTEPTFEDLESRMQRAYI
jgi:site-specific recombinase XerD